MSLTLTIERIARFLVESSKPVVERDVFVLRLCDATWCAMFRHGNTATAMPGPTEVSLKDFLIHTKQHSYKYQRTN